MNPSDTVTDGASSALVRYASIHEDPLIRQAIGVLEERLFKHGAELTSPASVREYLWLKLASEALEVFAVVFLDSQHRVIAFEPMFHGTIDGASVYPRAVLKRAIEHNCSAVIFAHYVVKSVLHKFQLNDLYAYIANHRLIVFHARTLQVHQH